MTALDTVTNTDASDGRPRGAALAAIVARAASVVPRRYQFSAFVAVNPLAGREQQRFEDAADDVEAAIGAPATLPIDLLRAQLAARASAKKALDLALGEFVDPQALGESGRGLEGLSAREVLAVDVTEGPVLVHQSRRPATVAAVVDDVRSTTFAAVIDEEIARWCARFADESSPLHSTSVGLYELVRSMLVVDWRLPRGVRSVLEHLPADTLEALGVVVDRFAVEPDSLQPLFEACLSALPGWAGHLQLIEHGSGRGLVELITARLALELAWIAGEPAMAIIDPQTVGALLASRVSDLESDDLAARVDFLCVRFGITGAMGRETITQICSLVPDTTRKWIVQRALEISFRDQLTKSFESAVPEASDPRAQVVCCIDPRSEGLRRHLEASGSVTTYGFAGFFAMAVSYASLEGGAEQAQCPVLVSPSASVRERPLPGGVESAARHIRRSRRRAARSRAVAAISHNPATSLFGAELFGWSAGPQSLLASWRVRPRRTKRSPRLAVSVEPDVSLSESTQVLLAKVLLSVTGLAPSFGPVVVLVGHGSTTTNNPYAAALDCGACGGHRGAPNARIAAAVCNRPAVRDALRSEGIDIPDTTWFVAAEHDTATDAVTVLDPHLIPSSHHAAIQELTDVFSGATVGLANERSATLGEHGVSGARALRDAQRRSANWGEAIPEWGLAGNAAMVVAPRRTTCGVDLGRRVFLHSYDPHSDHAGDALETILTAPMVVAQWINCQYYFSAVAPNHFGAGTKTVHNVVGTDVGVLAGAGGDLRVGLPWQSVGAGETLAHEPLRLAVIIEAPLERIDAVIGRNRVLRDLTRNGWVAITARSEATAPWCHRDRAGMWSTDESEQEKK